MAWISCISSSGLMVIMVILDERVHSENLAAGVLTSATTKIYKKPVVTMGSACSRIETGVATTIGKDDVYNLFRIMKQI